MNAKSTGPSAWERNRTAVQVRGMIQKYQTALGIQEPERSYTTGNSPPLVSALLAARPQRGVRPFSYVCTDTNQFSRTSLMFSSSVQRGPHVAECDLLRSLAPGLSSLSSAAAVSCWGRLGSPSLGLSSSESLLWRPATMILSQCGRHCANNNS